MKAFLEGLAAIFGAVGIIGTAILAAIGLIVSVQIALGMSENRCPGPAFKDKPL